LEKIILKAKQLIEKLFRNRFKKTKSYKYWTVTEINLFTSHSDKEIAQRTGRSIGAVRAKRKRTDV